MKNVTLSVDDKVLSTVRRYAAEAETTVNALVRDFLERIAIKEDRGRTARRRIRELSDASPARLGEKSWSRDDLHAR